MLIGSDQREAVKPPALATKPVETAKLYNAAYLIRPDGSTAAVYRKIHLVPFGEYVPFSHLLFFVGRRSKRAPTSRPVPAARWCRSTGTWAAPPTATWGSLP